MAEQLVEVLAVVSPSLLQPAEQRKEFNSTAVCRAERLYSISQWRSSRFFFLGQGSAELSGADLARLHDFSPGQGSTALLDAPLEHFQWFFALFPGPKKVRRLPGRWVLESSLVHFG